MKFGAVIVAAGLSSRMGDFKPMLNIGPISVAQHVIAAFRQAGVNRIVVVTGHNAAQLREHLSDSGVIFLHNEHYQTTQMFDSAKIGLSFMKNCCDRVFFTPVDIPLFTPLTVKKLMESDSNLVSPMYAGKQGHPLLMSAAVIDAILKDFGEGGLKGAVTRLRIPMTHVEVDDSGVLRDADTPEEFQALLAQYHRSRNTLYPSDTEIEQMLIEANTPEHVRAHCEAVAAKAAHLASQIDHSIDPDLLRAACLLHDMARASHKDHAAAATDYLNRKGYLTLAEIIGQHHDLKPPASIEAQLLYLADKLVQGTREVTLHERFSASRQKCTTTEAIEIWEQRYRDALQIAQHCQLLDSGNGGTP